MENENETCTQTKVVTSWIWEQWQRCGPAIGQAYLDEANRYQYGTADPDMIRIACKEHHRRTRRWTFDGTHWFGAGACDRLP